jgi:glycosyltransferase involved in cell wall biosynthesis
MDKLSVILIKYKEPENIIKECLESLLRQKNIKLEIIFLDQSSDERCKQMVKRFNNSLHTFIYHSIPDISLSFARNCGIKMASTTCIAFMDMDAFADQFWAFNISKGLCDDNRTGVVGGKIMPKYLGSTKWFHRSLYVNEIYSLLDLGESPKYVKKVIGANFAVNLDLIKAERFNENLGRVDGKLLGGEETEFCERLGRKGILIKYLPDAIVYHQIPKSRLKLSWIIHRFYFGGFSRAIRGGNPEPSNSHPNKYDYLFLVFLLVPYSFGFAKGKLNFRQSKINS